MSDSDSSEDEYISLSDRLKVKYVKEIEENIKKIENIKDYDNGPPTKKRRKIASWVEAKLNPSAKSTTGPGCSICISTFEEVQMDHKEVKYTYYNLVVNFKKNCALQK